MNVWEPTRKGMTKGGETRKGLCIPMGTQGLHAEARTAPSTVNCSLCVLGIVLGSVRDISAAASYRLGEAIASRWRTDQRSR